MTHSIKDSKRKHLKMKLSKLYLIDTAYRLKDKKQRLRG
jgi:hypothetical protein